MAKGKRTSQSRWFQSFFVVSDSWSTSAKCGFKCEASLMRRPTMGPNTGSDYCNEAVFSLTRKSASSSVGGASAFEDPSLFGSVALACTSLHASAVSTRRFDSNGYARGSNLLRSAMASIAFTVEVTGGLRLRLSSFSCLRPSLNVLRSSFGETWLLHLLHHCARHRFADSVLRWSSFLERASFSLLSSCFGFDRRPLSRSLLASRFGTLRRDPSDFALSLLKRSSVRSGRRFFRDDVFGSLTCTYPLDSLYRIVPEAFSSVASEYSLLRSHSPIRLDRLPFAVSFGGRPTLRTYSIDCAKRYINVLIFSIRCSNTRQCLLRSVTVCTFLSSQHCQGREFRAVLHTLPEDSCKLKQAEWRKLIYPSEKDQHF